MRRIKNYTQRFPLASSILFVLILVSFASSQSAPARQTNAESAGTNRAIANGLTVSSGKFLLNGHPYQIISGEMHYARIPRAYWRDRLRKAKAMGLNTISTYVFWNMHEPKPGVYDFSGNLDVAGFIRIAQQEGLHVILRPGPYACAEWELGGYPAWLLADPKMVLRSNDPRFMVPASRWMMRLGKELAPLQMGRGGPIIAVQLENEYGSFGSDKVYLEHMHQLLFQAGFTNALIYTADGPEELADGTLPGVLAVANFGPGDARDAFTKLEKFEPGKPLMSGEYWVGWFDHWGAKHVVVDQKKVVEEYAWMLQRGYSVNLYMFHGGTSFGFMNGANIDAKTYEPDVTSYDYDAPLDESGRPTKLYYALRNVIAQHEQAQENEGGKTAQTLPAVPDSPATISIPQFSLTESASLWKMLPTPISAAHPESMEMLGQSYGYILYRTMIAKPVRGELVFEHMQDYAQIYLNGVLAGTLDRRLHQNSLSLDVPKGNTQLDILVENTGRVNFTRAIRTERKGIFGSVKLAGNSLVGWQIYSLPMDDVNNIHFGRSHFFDFQFHSEHISKAAVADGPMFYRGKFFVQSPGDTFLDMRTMKKGVVWVNGHPLGRFWNIGPQETLYVPGPWLKSGENTVVVFDLMAQPDSQLRGLVAPILDGSARKN
ncbi:MAG TPA: glycoside hydrolase family 35 protein [Acidobacteriaceae bacterium]|jgi:beta-galactosidase|nr:glycoside hydrolase family 35 protein [Acidobacteriaceae bacterium]